MPVDLPAAPTALPARRPGRGDVDRARRRRRALGVVAAGTLAVLAVGWLAGSSPDRRGGDPTTALTDVPATFPFGLLEPAVAAAEDAASTDTPSGPLTASDRDLLVRVRQAGLWEQPAGEMAQERAVSSRVGEVGRLIALDHHVLDEEVRKVARQLQVSLPDQANADQRNWVDEMSRLRGTAFELSFVNRLRVAHGRVFEVVAQVRATTRNTVVRTFAQVAVTVVMRHMSLLESTGQVARVEAEALTPPAPQGPVTVPVVVTVVGLAAAANLVIAARRSRT